ncbi:Hypothetical protein CINCED_3A010279 [Cinara cedri]|uniref:Uncharacterized protein n=1 Tax=Cinara cedri TaxID=506608 RepID=A0A5E4N201_9HEMI|nr:Hypothetical protein CINCED_3A010279 [Cinara cedri]
MDRRTVSGPPPLLVWLLVSSWTVSGARVGPPVNVGTVLYGKRDLAKYWTDREAAGLRCREMADQLIPRRIPDGAAFVDYFKLIEVQSSLTVDSQTSRRRIMSAVADAVGGYASGVLWPHVRASYYDGRVPYDLANRLYGIVRKIKYSLDTDGRGWITAPERDESDPASVRANNVDDDFDDVRDIVEKPCAGLRLQREPSAYGDGAVVPIPTFDDNRHPGSVAVPFAAGKWLFSVTGPPAATNEDVPFLVRYYLLAVGCTSTNPNNRFRRDVSEWLNSTVVPLLASRRRWYPALAGASRVVRAAARAAANRAANRAAAGVNSARDKRTVESMPAAAPLPPDFGVDDWPSCDDGPSGKLPNPNVFRLAILLSLTTVWLSFKILVVHKGIRYILDVLARWSPPRHKF